MSFFDPQNPGIGGLDELTDSETLVVQQIAGLGDPNADRILFWDDSAGSYKFLTVGTNLTITGTTLDATGGSSGLTIATTTITGGTNTRILYNNAGVLGEYSVIPVSLGGTNATSAGITAFNNITGYTASGATGTTSTNLVFSTSPTLVTPTLGSAAATALGVGKSVSASIRGEFKTDATFTQGLRVEGDQVASRLGFSAYVTGDSFVRFTFGIDGRMEWGAGTVTADTNLYRSAADTLKTDDNLIVGTPGTAAGSVAVIDGTQTLTNKTLTAPKIANGGFIADANGNELIIFTTTASAVNEVTLANAAAGNNPTLSASGGDTNIGINLTPKGTGAINIRGNATQAGTLALYEDTDDGSNYSAFRGSARSADIIYVMPTADPTAGQVLSAGAPSAGVSQLSWATTGGGTSKMMFTQAFEYYSETGAYADRFRGASVKSGSGSQSVGYGGMTFSTGGTVGSRAGMLGSTPGNSNLAESIYSKNPEFAVVHKMDLSTSSQTASIIFGGAYIATGYPDTSGNYTPKHFGFIIDGTIIYASNADGTTQTKTDVTSGITMTDNNTYRAIMTSGTDVKFYINGTLVATHTTNLPTGQLASSQLWGFHISNDSTGSDRSMYSMPITYGWWA